MMRSKNVALAIYGFQGVLAATVIAGGIAKLAGAEVMVQAFRLFGLGCGSLTILGGMEIIAGIFLLWPRGGAVGAMLLAALMFGTLGVTLGRIGSATAYTSQQQTFAPLLEQRAIGPPEQRDI
jgi:hypothetical protein